MCAAKRNEIMPNSRNVTSKRWCLEGCFTSTSAPVMMSRGGISFESTRPEPPEQMINGRFRARNLRIPEAHLTSHPHASNVSSCSTSAISRETSEMSATRERWNIKIYFYFAQFLEDNLNKLGRKAHPRKSFSTFYWAVRCRCTNHFLVCVR